MKVRRYPGVRPFQAADKALFFGRDRDIADLYEMIRAERLVVLFGKSGYGKSSLLNAGVLPKLNSSIVKVQIRFGEYIADQSFTPVDILLQKVPIQSRPKPEAAFLSKLPQTLWTHFKQLDFDAKRNYILIFDQFEEFFSYPAEQQGVFRNQLAELFNGEPPEELREVTRELTREQRHLLNASMEIRLLFSIRSDRLHELDRLKDRLPLILHKRYELKALSREQAREAIVGPASLKDPRTELHEDRTTSRPLTDEWVFASPPFVYSETALQKVLAGLAISNTSQQSVEAFQLQVLCDSIETKIIEGLIPKSNSNSLLEVTTEDLPDFTEVLSQYYERRLTFFTQNRSDVARRVIEDGLVRYDPVTNEGRRLSVDGESLLKDFEVAGLSVELLRELENSFLVRREPNTLGGYNYELSHDMLLGPVIRAKKKRVAEEAEQRRREAEEDERKQIKLERKKIRLALQRNIIVGLFAIVLLWLAWREKKIANEAKNNARIEQQKADDAKNEAERQQYIADSANAEASKLKLEVALKSKILVLELIKKADENIYALNYSEALKNVRAATSLGMEKPSLSRIYLEIAYWEAETGSLDSAKLNIIAAARQLDLFDLIIKIEKAVSKKSLRVLMKQISPILFNSLEYRHFPNFIHIPSGEFDMKNEDSSEITENSIRKVRLPNFYMAETETTFWQFGLYIAGTGQNINAFAPAFGIKGDCPVVMVSWSEAALYANWLSLHRGLKPVYIFVNKEFQKIDSLANGYRLPTEEQWEYAAGNGVKHTIYSWGNNSPIGKQAGNVADETAKKQNIGYSYLEGFNDGYAFTSPVRKFNANDFGLYDMSGNVWEWCQNLWYSDNQQDLNENNDKNNRVIRGGSWNYGGRSCRVSNRSYRVSNSKTSFIGFRLVAPY